jgi:hypothetical protein
MQHKPGVVYAEYIDVCKGILVGIQAVVLHYVLINFNTIVIKLSLSYLLISNVMDEKN